MYYSAIIQSCCIVHSEETGPSCIFLCFEFRRQYQCKWFPETFVAVVSETVTTYYVLSGMHNSTRLCTPTFLWH